MQLKTRIKPNSSTSAHAGFRQLELGPSWSHSFRPSTASIPVWILIRMLSLWCVGVKCIFEFIISIFILTTLTLLRVILNSAFWRWQQRLKTQTTLWWWIYKKTYKSPHRKKEILKYRQNIIILLLLLLHRKHYYWLILDYLGDKVIPNAEVWGNELFLKDGRSFLLH